MTSVINPFFAARTAQQRPTTYAKLPRSPINASPVPGLTSLYHNADAGNYGSRSYPGNCGGHLIRDLMRYFRPRRVFDPMSGSGTCRDVCLELGIDCWSNDLRSDFDLCDPRHFIGESRLLDEGSFDFAWLHPPYWRQKRYCRDTRDLSRTGTLEQFLERYQLVMAHSAHVLSPSGKLAVLMGDYCDRDEGFVPLTWHTKQLAFERGLVQCCTDIIRFSHGASSSRKVYRSSFIPGLHDVCMIFEKPKHSSAKEALSR